ncbi:MAG: hypothetical protein QG673_1914 [Pseudomonadota bacterium]|nr:hypothetical protein [Pseudomonadota bacterium]
MNPLLNKLYFFYKNLSENIYTNNKMIGDSLSTFIIEIDTTLNKLKTLRDLLVKKDYSAADNLASSINLDQRTLQSISQLINDLKENNLDYDLLIGIEADNYKLLLDKFNQLENNFNNFVTSKSEKNYPENASNISSLDNINLISNITKKLDDNLDSLDNKITNIQDNIKNIDLSLNSHLQSINDDFTKVILSYKEQTINSVNNIKNTTLDTSNMITKELPTQIKQITDTIPEQIKITIKKSLWPNLTLFGAISIIFILSFTWIMGRTMGHTIVSDLSGTMHSHRQCNHV